MTSKEFQQQEKVKRILYSAGLTGAFLEITANKIFEVFEILYVEKNSDSDTGD